MKNKNNPKTNFSVFIPDGESVLTSLVVHCLSSIPGIKINIFSKNKFTPVRYSRFVTKFFYEKIQSEVSRISVVNRLASETNSDIILPIDEPVIELFSSNKDSLSKTIHLAPLPEINVFKIVSNKWLISKFMSENNLPHPPTILATDLNKLINLSNIQFPVLIKPIIGNFGKGIKLFENQILLQNYLNDIESSKGYIIQTYIKGFDIDCSVLCRNGRILEFTIQKEKYKSNKKFGVPAAIEFLYNEHVYKIVKELMQKLNWTGLAHVDLRYDETNGDYKILEVNPRFWGSLLGSLHAGVNFPYKACLAGFGEEIESTKYKFIKYSQFQDWIVLTLKRVIKGEKTDINLFDTDVKQFIKDPMPKIFGFILHIIKQLLLNIKNL